MYYRLSFFSAIFALIFLVLGSFYTFPVYAEDLLPPPPLPRGCGLQTTPINTDEETCCVSGYIKLGDTVLGGVSVTITAHGVTHALTTTIGTESPYPLYSSFLSTLTPAVRVGDNFTISAQWQDFNVSQDFVAVGGGQRIDLDLQSGSRQTTGKLTFIDQVGGVSNALTKQDTLIYMGEGPRLSIVDVEDSAAPRLVGQTTPLPGVVRDVAVAGNVAYVAAAGAGLRVYDVSKPTNPDAVAIYAVNASAFGVTVENETVYLGNGLGGVQVYTKTVTGELVWITQFDTPGFTRKASVDDDLLYIADGYAGLRIADISDPVAPVEIGSIDTPGDAHRVTVAGNRAYVADGGGGLRIIDIADPSAPKEIGFLETNSSVTAVAIRGDRAYLASTFAGLQLVDISNPTAPQILDSSTLHIRDIVYDEDLFYMSGAGGLEILYGNNQSEIASAGAYRTIGFASDIQITRDRALVADWPSGLWSISTETPSRQRDHLLYPTERGAWKVSVSGERAFLAAKGIHVLDLTNPAVPQPIVQNLYGDARDVAVGNNFAYVANGNSGLRVVALTDSAVTNVYETPTSGPAHHVHLRETESPSQLYVADQAGVQLFALNNPAVPETPQRLSTQSRINAVDTNEMLLTLAEGGMFAYSPSAMQGLRIIERSTFAQPQTDPLLVAPVSGYYTTTTAALDVALHDDRAYIAAGGLQIVDLTAPFTPTLAASVALPGSWSEQAGVAVSPDRVYVAAYDAGVYIFEHEFEENFEETRPSIAPQSTEWTILIYAAADNDLDAWLGYKAKGMLSNLLGAGVQPGVRVAVLYDGRESNDSYRYVLEADGSWVPEAMGELRMDDEATLQNFVEWGVENLPAKHTYLVIADHANGVLGIGLDMTSDDSGEAFLSTKELQRALRGAAANSGRKIDILHFDGCSFGLLENTGLAAGVADYVITSPNTGWGTFEYDLYRALAGTQSSPRQLAKNIAQHYADEVARHGYPYTIAVHDMVHFEAVRAATDRLGKALIEYIDQNPATRKAEVSALRRTVQTYDSGNYRVDEDDRYVDLADLAEAVQTLNDGAVEAAARDVVDQIEAFTIAEHHSSGRLPAEQNNLLVDLDAAHGLGIYYPSKIGGSIYTKYIQHQLFTITSEWGWASFLAQGVPALAGQESESESEQTLLAPIQIPIPVQQRWLYLPIGVR